MSATHSSYSIRHVSTDRRRVLIDFQARDGNATTAAGAHPAEFRIARAGYDLAATKQTDKQYWAALERFAASELASITDLPPLDGFAWDGRQALTPEASEIPESLTSSPGIAP